MVWSAKRLINRLSNAGAAGHFAAEREITFGLIGKPHQVEAITVNFKNRAPVFKDVGWPPSRSMTRQNRVLRRVSVVLVT